MPAPPYCSGHWMPSRPSAASCGISSAGKCCASSHSRTCGPISVSANSRTRSPQQLLLLRQPEVHVPYDGRKDCEKQMMKTLLLVIASDRRRRRPALCRHHGFFGANTTPSNRPATGFAVGAGLLIVGFEFEYANTERRCQRRRAVAQDRHGQRPAADAGRHRAASSRTSRRAAASIGKSSARAATRASRSDTGGGVKISLVGPLRLRVDYRVFKLGSGALTSPAHRIYAGLNLKF